MFAGKSHGYIKENKRWRKSCNKLNGELRNMLPLKVSFAGACGKEDDGNECSCFWRVYGLRQRVL